MITNLRSLVLFAATVATIAPACAQSSSTSNPTQGMAVVATTTQIADFARRIGGQFVSVKSILKPGTDAHDFEPSPADSETIRNARVVLANGIGLDAWLDETIAATRPSGAVVIASEGLRTRKSAGGEVDPHVWHDPTNVKTIARTIERAFAAADPVHTASYQANATRFVAELEALDVDVRAELSQLTNRKIVTNHDALGYYLDRYDLEFVGAVIPSPDSQAELTARDAEDIVRKIRAAGVKAVFAETSLPARAAETIAREAGVKVVAGDGALYTDSLGPPGTPGETYIGMVRHNTRVIVENLR